MIKVVAALSAAAVLSGCASFNSVDNLKPGSPRFMAGTRLGSAALSSDKSTLDHFSSYNITAPSHPGADLLLSFVADVAILPIVASYSLVEPVLYAP